MPNLQGFPALTSIVTQFCIKMLKLPYKLSRVEIYWIFTIFVILTKKKLPPIRKLSGYISNFEAILNSS